MTVILLLKFLIECQIVINEKREKRISANELILECDLAIDYSYRVFVSILRLLDQYLPDGLIFQCTGALVGLKIRVSPVRSWPSAPDNRTGYHI